MALNPMAYVALRMGGLVAVTIVPAKFLADIDEQHLPTLLIKKLFGASDPVAKAFCSNTVQFNGFSGNHPTNLGPNFPTTVPLYEVQLWTPAPA
jgi:hypothetical protein